MATDRDVSPESVRGGSLEASTGAAQSSHCLIVHGSIEPSMEPSIEPPAPLPFALISSSAALISAIFPHPRVFFSIQRVVFQPTMARRRPVSISVNHRDTVSTTNYSSHAHTIRFGTTSPSRLHRLRVSVDALAACMGLLPRPRRRESNGRGIAVRDEGIVRCVLRYTGTT
jgi:hypothetical protein